VFWVISVYFNIRNTLPKFCPFLLGHSVYIFLCIDAVVSLLTVIKFMSLYNKTNEGILKRLFIVLDIFEFY